MYFKRAHGRPSRMIYKVTCPGEVLIKDMSSPRYASQGFAWLCIGQASVGYVIVNSINHFMCAGRINTQGGKHGGKAMASSHSRSQSCLPARTEQDVVLVWIKDGIPVEQGGKAKSPREISVELRRRGWMTTTFIIL